MAKKLIKGKRERIVAPKKEAAKAGSKAAAKPKEQSVKHEIAQPKALPVCEGVKVIEVMNDGRETATHYHCRMADGTTRHVPKTLFE